MHIIPHNLLSDERMWAHPCLLYSHPPGQEQVPQDEAHGGYCDEIVRGLGRRLPVTLVAGSLSSYDVIILYRTLLYILMMWHSFLYHESSYVWDLILAHLVIISRTGFGPLKSVCDRSGIRAMLNVVRSLDRNGQPLPTYLCYSDSF
jgi:hypothetical protein